MPVLNDTTGAPIGVAGNPLIVEGELTLGTALEITNDAGNPIPVSGTVEIGSASLAALETIQIGNFPATQAITGTVAATQSGTWTVNQSGVWNVNASQSGGWTVGINNFPATQVVSGTGTFNTQLVSGVGTSKATPIITRPASDNLSVTAVGAAAAAVTVTLPAAGAGLFHYIDSIEITMYNTAARTGTATPVTVTSTNFPTANAWTFPSAGAIGTTTPYMMSANRPIKSATANTNTTIVCPATTGVIWRVNVFYSVGA